MVDSTVLINEGFFSHIVHRGIWRWAWYSFLNAENITIMADQRIGVSCTVTCEVANSYILLSQGVRPFFTDPSGWSLFDFTPDDYPLIAALLIGSC